MQFIPFQIYYEEYIKAILHGVLILNIVRLILIQARLRLKQTNILLMKHIQFTEVFEDERQKGKDACCQDVTRQTLKVFLSTDQ